MITQTEQMTYRLSLLNTQQQRLTYQTSTQEKLQDGSDDSMLYSRLILVDEKVRTFEGLKTQIQKTQVQNNMADSSMAEIKKILENIKEQLVKANTATTTDDGITAIASSLAGLKENLFQLANTQVENEYVFAGSDSSIKPFEKDVNGKITYVGNSQLKKVAIEEGSYRERGINGFDMMTYPSSTAYKGGTLTFKETDRIIDQDGNEWKLNSPTNDTLTKYDLNGNATTDTINPVTSDALTPPTYSASMPNVDGTKFEAKTSIFDLVDATVNALKKVDSNGNPISAENAKSLVANYQGEVDKAYDSVNIAHANLGGKNKIFEISLERVSSKLTQFDILSRNLGSADLAQVAIESKALELTYTALYSTISKTNQLSLVNFLK
ncbi:flagellar hook-associated protein FlgL [Arcobacter caeni]|uniref:Flagellar hook-associated protein 3 n=1 Tax=Arcobacter caeni TaxID=1912877 RepID=A0A363CYW0_9BACT|nr:flagellar hook-associated protein FlgL [Arcobacter caeni]PUE63997.1 flagellar hook-associated protein 3 [Arcobacter caeni]